MALNTQAVIDLLPEDGTPVTFSEWKADAISAGLWSAFQRWHSLKTSGQIVATVERSDPADPASVVMLVSRPTPTP
jgi:hypothetical protein